jgi:two-component system phosphate regulon sensor histidine kinase PhoR
VCSPGLIYLVRHSDPTWREDERLLLAALGREIDNATRQRRLQHRQARLIEQLRALDERKDAFVSTVTHELRTPLTSILGYTEMLADGDGGELSVLQQRGVSAILRNAHRLQDTVGDLLLLNAADTRAGAPHTGVDLAAVMAGVLGELEPLARAKDITVTGTSGPAWVSGEPSQLGRMMHKLLDNAVKFTRPGGHITYRLCTEARSVRFAVTDTGIGIPAEDLPGLGTAFHRAANAVHQAVQGSGLGLAIVHAIAREHGGAVAVESQVGQGSTLTITLPAVEAPAPEPLPAH